MTVASPTKHCVHDLPVEACAECSVLRVLASDKDKAVAFGAVIGAAIGHAIAGGKAGGAVLGGIFGAVLGVLVSDESKGDKA